jgi:UDP-N-acetylmuramyl pentapeptide phosphotransferase/UDP-N-acetylglucosamine-1-phosphate transferase
VYKKHIVRYEICTPLLSFAAAFALIAWLARSRWARFALDHPNRRSLHDVPVPRSGGLGILLGIAIACIVVGGDVAMLLWPGLVLLALVSFIDDIRGVNVGIRFLTQLVAGGTVAAGAVYPDFGVGAAVVFALGTTWMTNLYNFMDGSDGLAGGMTLFGFFFYGMAAWLAGAEQYALLNFSIAAAAAAFLIFNFHPARIFMGDAGAVPLGFLAASLGVIGWERHYWFWWFPFLVFSPFIIDSTVTLVRRALRRERIWEAHKDHYYQRLVRMGWGHRNTALAEYALMLSCGMAAFAALASSPATQASVIAAAALAYFTLARAVDRAWLRFDARASA